MTSQYFFNCCFFLFFFFWIVSIFFIFLVGCQSSLVYKLVDNDDWNDIDLICFCAFCGAWVLIHIFLMIRSKQVIAREEAKLEASEGKDEKRTLLNATQRGVIAHHFKHDENIEKLVAQGKPALFVAKQVKQA